MQLPHLLGPCRQFCVAAEGERGNKENEIPDRLGRLRVRVLFQLQQELGQEDVTLARPEVVQQGLRHGGGVLEEAEDRDEHLNDLERRDIAASSFLHVLDAEGDAAFVVKIRDHRLREGVS